ncbi:DUF3515 family protein [Microbacterium sp.]|uniref:DUF3515 family protein n=1 Tax=Microbacterium sp. TaxID=51671 RepID=UPI003C741C5A
MKRPRPLVAARALIVGLGVAFSVTGCSSTVSMTPAEGANDPACAAVTVRLPQNVGGQERRWTDAQATGAWGSPTTVLLTCGLEPPVASELECRTLDGIDWLIDDSEAPHYRFTTFGRNPAVEVYVDYDEVGSGGVLRALSTAVDQLPGDGRTCTPAS